MSNCQYYNTAALRSKLNDDYANSASVFVSNLASVYVVSYGSPYDDHASLNAIFYVRIIAYRDQD